VRARRAARLAQALAQALAAGAFVAACHRAGPGASHQPRAASAAGAETPAAAEAASPARTDSLQGIVRVVGVDALPQVVLVLDDASPAVTLDGPASLRRVAGLRIAVLGDRAGARFAVRRFVVLSANGVAATDGLLAADGETLVLVTPDGARHRLVNPPSLLRASVGHRAWVSGPLDREPVAFGIIE
jgi:hypothetical protein